MYAFGILIDFDGVDQLIDFNLDLIQGANMSTPVNKIPNNIHKMYPQIWYGTKE